MANNNDKGQTGQVVKTQKSNVTLEEDAQKKAGVKTGGSAPQQSAVPAAEVVAQNSTVPVAGSGSQECAVSAEQSSDSTNNTRRKAYIVIPSIVLVLSILCVSAAIYLYLQHAIVLEPRVLYYIIAGGVLALGCGVLSLWKLIAECKKGKDSPAISAVASSATSTVNTVESAASVESAREAEIDCRITKLTENIQKQSLDIARTQEITSILERRLIAVLSEYKIAEKGDTLADTLKKLGVDENVTSGVRREIDDDEEEDLSLPPAAPADPAAPAGNIEVEDVVGGGRDKSTRAA
ncbi:hypothetical protein APHMUC_0404 [Anaplasma phagocytophilum str. ApMUC09]|uniref:Uncharacterized protein n=1 Tax=Anaplasma phagocytophilum str. ApMUC09 TaxID=1359152 RepID=A0A0F3N8P2_ANAPH|nr:hypothetical protein APHMUC_0404 [Anaplasma phagocytophilum str. ApMUC09]